MPDDLDTLLRTAMKTLDDQVPSGYFEALPDRTLARLEGSSMQQGSSGTTVDNRDKVMAPPPVMAAPPVAATPVAASVPAAPVVGAPAAAAPAAKERDEDSGLHDIRNLAQSTKQRLSSRRSTANPVLSDDALAASSGSWKNIALPQPAKMVSLPELADLPSKQEVQAAEKAAEKAEKAARRASKKDLLAEAATAAAASAVEAPITSGLGTAGIETRKAFSLPSQQHKTSRGPILAILGLGVAAAAGGVIYMQMDKADAPTETVAAKGEAERAAPAAPPAAAPVVTAIAEQPAQELAKTDELAIASGAAAAPEAQEGFDDSKADGARAKAGKPSKLKKGSATVEIKDEPKDDKAPEKVDPPKKSGGDKEAEGEPSFDALLKEAGVEEKKAAKPKLEKKSLSGDDFKKGMAAVAAKAQACYKGTQGTASVKLTVSPSGAVSKVSVGGQFAGAPEAKCVETAVKGASFPAWDGGPQSFNYSYMLAD